MSNNTTDPTTTTTTSSSTPNLENSFFGEPFDWEDENDEYDEEYELESYLNSEEEDEEVDLNLNLDLDAEGPDLVRVEEVLHLIRVLGLEKWECEEVVRRYFRED